MSSFASRLIPKARAAGLHLLISRIITAAVFAAMIALWYPWPIFLAAGAPQLLLLLGVCDVVLGPLLTFIVFAPGKPKLLLDLSVIAALQLAALGYGAHTVFVARPVFNVFVVDRFELVSQADLEPEELQAAPAAMRKLSLTGPRLVAAEPPADPAQRSALLLSAAAGGADLRHLPRYYVEHEALRLRALAKSQAFDKLLSLNPAEKVEALRSQLGREASQLRYFPLRGAKRDLTVVVDAADGRILRIADLQPWAR